MLISKRAFARFECARVKGLGLLVASLMLINQTQGVHRREREGVVFAELAFPIREDRQKLRFRLAVTNRWLRFACICDAHAQLARTGSLLPAA